MNTLLGVIVQLKSLCDGNDTDSDLAVLRDNIAPDLRKIYDAQETGSASLRKNFSSFMKSSNSLDEIPDLASVEAFLDKEGISCAEHTIAYAFLLFAAIKKNEKAVLKPSILKCIETLVHQGKHWHFSVGAEFICYVVQKYANALFAESQYERALPTLKTAIEKIRTNRKMLLTALHPLLALACLKTRNYDFAADILTDFPCEIDSLHHLDSMTVLSHFYYSGTIALALQKYSTGLELLSTCFYVPAQNISLIHIAAFKKYVFAYIICHGSSSQLPHGCSRFVSKFLPLMCPEYTEIAEAAKADLQEAIMKNFQDKIENLALIALHNFFKLRIKKLTNTYRSLSLQQIATQCGAQMDPKAVAQLLLSMINDREIFAEIDGSSGVVTFKDDPEEFASQETIQSLKLKVAESQEIYKESMNLYSQICSDSKFIDRISKNKATQEVLKRFRDMSSSSTFPTTDLNLLL